MKKIELKLQNVGFNKFQEKENCVFYEKMVDYPSETHQICLIFDKKSEKFKSMDTFIINDSEMKSVENDKMMSSMITSLIS